MMNSWLAGSARFAELTPDLNEAILVLDFGEGAEEWRLEGGSEALQQQFLAQSRWAGEALINVHLVNHETGSPVEPEVRWFRLLRERNSPGKSSPLVIDSAGVALSNWTLENIAARSAALCTDLHRTNPIKNDSNWLIKKFREDRIGTTIKLAGACILVFVLLRLVLR